MQEICNYPTTPIVPGIFHDHQITLFLTWHLWKSQAAMDASQRSVFKSAADVYKPLDYQSEAHFLSISIATNWMGKPTS
jgi:hypothetical protein